VKRTSFFVSYGSLKADKPPKHEQRIANHGHALHRMEDQESAQERGPAELWSDLPFLDSSPKEIPLVVLSNPRTTKRRNNLFVLGKKSKRTKSDDGQWGTRPPLCPVFVLYTNIHSFSSLHFSFHILHFDTLIPSFITISVSPCSLVLFIGGKPHVSLHSSPTSTHNPFLNFNF
jgi:hypothetical protein